MNSSEQHYGFAVVLFIALAAAGGVFATLALRTGRHLSKGRFVTRSKEPFLFFTCVAVDVWLVVLGIVGTISCWLKI